MKIGVICPSEIAFRRFMPALMQVKEFEYMGVAVNTIKERFGDSKIDSHIVEEVMKEEYQKADKFVATYGGKIYDGYESMIDDSEIEAIYIPLPPALHYYWAKKAIQKHKHVLIEKPATINIEHTRSLIYLAKEYNVALHENYMFDFHSQLDEIEEIIESGVIGNVRLYQISFGFPLRAQNDFRYNKSLGGGALIDCGGYPLKYANRLLGGNARVIAACLKTYPPYEVDMYGSGMLKNANEDVVQISFGMDNEYKCSLEVWGSKGIIKTGRVLTAPAGFTPTADIIHNNQITTINLPADDSFKKSIIYFNRCIRNMDLRNESYESILKQANLVEEFRVLAGG